LTACEKEDKLEEKLVKMLAFEKADERGAGVDRVGAMLGRLGLNVGTTVGNMVGSTVGLFVLVNVGSDVGSSVGYNVVWISKINVRYCVSKISIERVDPIS
jgi:hypothetical protein